MKIIILGASGMIGHCIFEFLMKDKDLDVYGTVRSDQYLSYCPDQLTRKILALNDVNDQTIVNEFLATHRPDIVINCIGITKHLPEGLMPIPSIEINALLPHILNKVCANIGSRLIHISSDCVFSGSRGNYCEEDIPDAKDLYGKTKALGEIFDANNCLTIRTSTIGRELGTSYGLLEWFLFQGEFCKGYGGAIFSGLPTVILAQIIHKVIIPRPELAGLYNIAADPIDKYTLLKLICEIYSKKINIEFDDKFQINRSLDATKFKKATGYTTPSWPEMIKIMHDQEDMRKINVCK
ncbi:dTDP-4-dehydrorhamnose reductase [Polynucleobacter sphagniphilus]|uniref:dTDP-4-dehydrorhamnose reductase family protein n=1 Tax=Polynucleobacter sphagniphilus TaxID=1743169 RepID=UPI002476F6CB|nr:SDR family oxidoreductase [Polynucleobacter sphagniphilus]MDH6303169.1 dTDP-4-dehydrorhamnose reductase [Polynucleobacter sphagniphilus]